MAETLGKFRYRLSKTPAGMGVDTEVMNGFINGRLDEISKFTQWSRQSNQSVIQSAAAYNTGTISITIGSTAGTGVGTTFTSAYNGWRIRFEFFHWYTFTFGDATDFTLDRPFEGIGGSDAVNVPFTLWQPVFQVPPDCRKIKSMTTPFFSANVDEQSLSWLNQKDPNRTRFGPPVAFVPSKDAADGIGQIELWPAPQVIAGFPIDYQTKPILFTTGQNQSTADFNDWVSIPALFEGVSADLYRHIKNDQGRAQDAETRFTDLLKEMAGEDARNTPPITPNMADRFTAHRRARCSNTYGIWEH